MLTRNITANLLAALADSPVVLLNGARQTGKSTLVKTIAAKEHPARYLTLDDVSVLSAIRHDPQGFLAGLDGPVIVDEVQRAPELFVSIKAEVDRNRQPGRYLLTGSANVLLLPKLSESLAGRMEILSLWPLSQGELEGVREGFVDALFADKLPSIQPSAEDRAALLERIIRGGYPEVVSRANEARRRAWFGSYLTTILQRDVRDLANIEGLTDLPRLLSLLATRSAGLINFAELSRTSTIAQSTLKRYMGLLETTFLVQHLPAWSGNLGKRLVKAAKLTLNDTGLMAHLLGTTGERMVSEGLIGPLLENFVAMELRKQITWSELQPQMFHWRTQTGQEVDILLEDARGRIVGIEVKASATVGSQDFKGLKALAEAIGDRFLRGIVLHTGRESIPFGSSLYAMPVDALWRVGEGTN
jgi:predicted AAA+ superfamily ATPase